MKLAALSLSFVVVLAVGCQPAASTSSTPTTPTSSAAAPTESSAPKPVTESKTEQKEPTEKLDVPTELQHAGARYSGLLSEKVRTYTVTGFGEAQEGGNSARLVKVEGGKATFERQATGALAATGIETVVLDSKGVSVTAISGGTMGSSQLELPADLKVGSKWKQAGQMTVSGTEIKQDANLEVVAEEEVKVLAGTYKALKIVLKGTMSAGTNSGTMAATMWYAENVGAVKIETRFTPSTGEARSQTMELKSIE